MSEIHHNPAAAEPREGGQHGVSPAVLAPSLPSPPRIVTKTLSTLAQTPMSRDLRDKGIWTDSKNQTVSQPSEGTEDPGPGERGGFW